MGAGGGMVGPGARYEACVQQIRIECRRHRTGLHQQHVPADVLAQSRRQHGTRAAGTDDQHIGASGRDRTHGTGSNPAATPARKTLGGTRTLSLASHANTLEPVRAHPQPPIGIREFRMNEQLEATAAPEAPAASTASASSTDEPLIEADDLVEEVSIDGMCGVY